jgi:hypothetical protein
MSKFPALNLLAAKVKEVLPTVFMRGQEVSLVDAPVDAITLWMQKEKFLSFAGLAAPVPPGLSVFMADHLKTLSEVFDVVQNVVEDVLNPVDRALATLAHQPELLSVPVGFRWKEVKFPLRHIDPKDLAKRLADDFKGPGDRDERELPRVYHSASEIEAVYVRMNALRVQLDKATRKDINRLINSIALTSENFEDFVVHPQVAKELTVMLDVASEWLSLFGVVMKQIGDAVNCVDLTIKKIERMYGENKK